MDGERQRNRIQMGTIWIDDLRFEGALDEIEQLVRSGHGGYVVTPNVDHVVNAEKADEFRRAYDEASLSVVDGMPLVWASRLLGTPLPERIAGSDLTLPLMQRAAERGWSVYITGGAPGVADEAAAKLRQRYGLRIAGVDAPRISLSPGDGDESVAAAERIRRARPHLLLVAYGSPKQELWLHRFAAQIRPTVGLGVGATVDFIAGNVRRAPRWMSRSGLEWLFRLGQEPRRLWRRYLVNDMQLLPILWRTYRTPLAERVQRPM